MSALTDRLKELAPYVPGPVDVSRGCDGFTVRTLRGDLCYGMTGNDAGVVASLINSLPALIAYVEASEALAAIISTQDVYSGLCPREFVRTRVSGITLGGDSDTAWNRLRSARAALEQALGGEGK